MAADRFTFPQDLLVTDSIAIYDTLDEKMDILG